jgi:hypothetical protein
MMEAVRATETSVDNYFTQQYIPEDNSEHHTRRRENLKSHIKVKCMKSQRVQSEKYLLNTHFQTFFYGEPFLDIL